MLFNSFSFLIFYPLVFLAYWFVFGRNLRAQNQLLLVASLFFYGSWDYRFLFLLMFSVALCYYTGLKIAQSRTGASKKLWLWISVVLNVGFLAVFKYYDFFISSFSEMASIIGFQFNSRMLDLILPVGISFYTFHSLSYIIDLYYDRIKPEKDIVIYGVFVSYFPLLVAGPIERATHLLPQLRVNRTFDYNRALSGLRQVLWGFFKKVVIADGCAKFANQVFDHSEAYSGGVLALGAVFFAIQIYCDFSGYSDIALGISRLLGIELLRNFAFPYFSRDIAEFWRRWHISLTTWFRDYIYIPLGGSRGGRFFTIRNTFIIFLISGFWHGANWTFLVWGLLHALYFLPLLLFRRNRKNLDTVAGTKTLPTLKEFASMLLTFVLVTFAWIFFRADSLSHAFDFIAGLFQSQGQSIAMPSLWQYMAIVLLLVLEWNGRNNAFALEHFGNLRAIRWATYVVLAVLVFVHMGVEQDFIYFQF